MWLAQAGWGSLIWDKRFFVQTCILPYSCVETIYNDMTGTVYKKKNPYGILYQRVVEGFFLFSVKTKYWKVIVNYLSAILRCK